MIYLSAALALVGLAAVLAARNVALRWLAVVHGHKRAEDVEVLRAAHDAQYAAVGSILMTLQKRIEASEAAAEDALRKVKDLSTRAAFGGPRR